jgi:rare lipoprotein A
MTFGIAGPAAAQSGGTAPQGDPAAQSSASPELRVRISASGHVLAGRGARVRGRVRGPQGRRAVLIQLWTGKRWRTVDRARTTARGSFRGGWRARSPGRYRVRAQVTGRSKAKSRSRVVNVYRAARASWYGPGFYGRTTACGHRLRSGTIGVANKRLPCGTRVTFHYRGRTVVAPVIDRGPYAGGREWDLTAATKRRLGFPSTGTVWATR